MDLTITSRSGKRGMVYTLNYSEDPGLFFDIYSRRGCCGGGPGYNIFFKKRPDGSICMDGWDGRKDDPRKQGWEAIPVSYQTPMFRKLPVRTAELLSAFINTRTALKPVSKRKRKTDGQWYMSPEDSIPVEPPVEPAHDYISKSELIKRLDETHREAGIKELSYYDIMAVIRDMKTTENTEDNASVHSSWLRERLRTSCPKCGASVEKLDYKNCGPLVRIRCTECGYSVRDYEAFEKGYKGPDAIFDFWNKMDTVSDREG